MAIASRSEPPTCEYIRGLTLPSIPATGYSIPEKVTCIIAELGNGIKRELGLRHRRLFYWPYSPQIKTKEERKRELQ